MQFPTSFLFLSILSCSDCTARFAASFSRSSVRRAFFSSSVRGASSSVDSEKSTCSVFDAWNSACAWLLNFFPHSLQTRLRGSSPSLRAGPSSSCAASAAAALISSSGLSWFASSHSRAACTMGENKLQISIESTRESRCKVKGRRTTSGI